MHRAFLPTGPGLRSGLLLGALLLAGGALLPARPTFGQATSYRKPATQRLVFAYYHYDYQADPRKPSP